MPRPIWNGTLSFGLLNVPVALMSASRSTDLHFRMLDSKSNKPIRYERVNAETGEEVPWKNIVKAFEYKKGSYVVLKPEDIKSASSEGKEAVEVEAFVDAASVGPEYFEKPYLLVPGKKAEKGYVLLRETLRDTGKIGIARVVIRTREYLCAVLPKEDALMLVVLRYPQELVDVEDYKLPRGKPSAYRISAKEREMAKQLIGSMSGEWTPGDYRDEFSDRLKKVIEKRMKSKGVVIDEDDEEVSLPEDASTNVVDFMALLKKSLASNRRSPPMRSGAKAPRKRAAPRKTGKAAKKSANKKIRGTRKKAG